MYAAIILSSNGASVSDLGLFGSGAAVIMNRIVVSPSGWKPSFRTSPAGGDATAPLGRRAGDRRIDTGHEIFFRAGSSPARYGLPVVVNPSLPAAGPGSNIDQPCGAHFV